MTGATVRAAPQHRARAAWTTSLTRLVIWQLVALGGQVTAISLARFEGLYAVANPLSTMSFAVGYGSALWVLLRPELSRVERNVTVACLAVTPALMWRATNPLLFTGFDEQLHMRTLRDVVEGKSLFGANPLLEVSARYPGLEAITALVHQVGLPLMAAATLVIFVARMTLVAVLCDAVENLTGSERAGGIAVAVYALSPQFIFFNSQFSYQTVALPLALGAVSLIARARHSDEPLPLYGGAAVCLVALAMTHHLTSFLTTGFLVLWTLAEKGRARVAISFGAMAAVASTLAWAAVQSKLLRNYLKPIFDDYKSKFTGGVRRQPFAEASGATAPVPDRILLVYYAGVLCLAVAVLLLLALRNRREVPLRGPNLLVLGLISCFPALFASFLMPKGGEIFCRLSSLLFFPFSFLVAREAVRRFWRGPAAGHQFRSPRTALATRWLAVSLAAGLFVGAYVLGSGPVWARLPGPYMAAADTRSMDAETLAAVEWAGASLPSGSRIAADRVSSTLLASEAGLWPVMKGPATVDAAALYVAARWGQDEVDMARSMRLRYLYVDRRLALEPPRFGFYFQQGETGRGKQLTDEQLTKFDAAPDLELVYRHGPVSIYDLKRLGIADTRSGRFASEPRMAIWQQLALGIGAGLLIAALLRSRLWVRLSGTAKRLYGTTGPALSVDIGLAAACLAAVVMLLAGIWPTRIVVLSAALVVVLANPRRAASAAGRVARALRPYASTALLIALPVSLIMGVAIVGAAGEVETRVNRILHTTLSGISPPKPPVR